MLFVVLPGGTAVVSPVGAAVLSSVAVRNKRKLELILFNNSYTAGKTTNMFDHEFLKFSSFSTGWRVILLNIACA